MFNSYKYYVINTFLNQEWWYVFDAWKYCVEKWYQPQVPTAMHEGSFKVRLVYTYEKQKKHGTSPKLTVHDRDNKLASNNSAIPDILVLAILLIKILRKFLAYGSNKSKFILS